MIHMRVSVDAWSYYAQPDKLLACGQQAIQAIQANKNHQITQADSIRQITTTVVRWCLCTQDDTSIGGIT